MGSCLTPARRPRISTGISWTEDPYANWNDTGDTIPPPSIAAIPENMKLSAAALTLETSGGVAINKCTTFSANLHQQLMNSNHLKTNVICSPLSVLIGMASCMNGARKGTLQQIVDVLFPDEHLTNYSPDEIEELATVILKMAPYYNKVYPGANDMFSPMIRMAHKMWIQKGIKIRDEFLTSSGIAELETMNLSNPRKAAKRINGWCAENTMGIIQKVVTAEDLEHARWIIANVIYFKAKFCRRFQPTQTRRAMFYGDSSKSDESRMGRIQMMHSDKERCYVLNHRGFDVLRLDFRASEQGTSDLCFILAIQSSEENRALSHHQNQDQDLNPIDENLQFTTTADTKPTEMEKLQSVENESGDSIHSNQVQDGCDCFTAADIQAIDQEAKWIHGEVICYVPKFKYEWSTDINRDLLDMGIIDAFNQSADFSGITGSDSFFIDKVIHKAVIEVDEYGVEASAASVDIGQGKGISQRRLIKEVPTIRFDHPFDLYIWDRKTEMSLFGGRFNGLKRRM